MLSRLWEGKTVAIIASGPSVRLHDVEMLRGRVPCIVVNDASYLAPWADLLYAADFAWWEYHSFAKHFKGEKWTQHQGWQAYLDVANIHNIKIIKSKNEKSLSLNPELIHTGFNSGFQALNLAVLKGAKSILLLGIDCTNVNNKTHWFGDHPGKLNRRSPYDLFKQAFFEAAQDLKANNIKVYRCSEESTLTCFPTITLSEYLK